MSPRKIKHYTVIASNFAGYDFARAAIGNDTEIKMLLEPGAETHSFEPTPEDILEIKEADLFIYNGGESEEWVKRLLDSNDIEPEKTFRMMDQVELLKEDAGEYDEHIWTNPKNAIILIQKIADKLGRHTESTKQYVQRLEKIDSDFRETIKNASKKELIFGDRFPFLYFVHEYGLDYMAAFPGCSEQTEVSSSTLARLADEARKNNIKVILKIELTSDQIARAIADDVGDAKVLEFSAAHNISEDDFEAKITYADLMEKNVKILNEALI